MGIGPSWTEEFRPVSYTHLTPGVYTSAGLMELDKLPKRLITVSYTHLDVYKRQEELRQEINVMDAIWLEERSKIIQALRQSQGNIAKAAKSLGISRQLLRYRLKKYNIK